MEVGLVSCTKQKRSSPAKPRDLYSPSTYFRKASQYAERTHDQWYILSAKHGLLDPDGPKIKPYDETIADFSPDARTEWAQTVLGQIGNRFLDSQNSPLCLVFHAGQSYYEPLTAELDAMEISYSIPTEGLRFGETLQWYAEMGTTTE